MGIGVILRCKLGKIRGRKGLVGGVQSFIHLQFIKFKLRVMWFCDFFKC